MAYIDVAKIENIRFMCHKILPLVYDESLSYYETLCKVANKMNEVIDSTNQLDDNVDTLSSNLNTLSAQVQTIAENLNTFESDVTQRFNTLEASLIHTVDEKLDEVDSRVDTLESRVDGLIRDMNAYKAEMTAYINSTVETLTEEVRNTVDQALIDLDRRFVELDAELREYVKAQLQAYLDQIPEITTVTVYDPSTGKLTDIQTVVNNLYWDNHVNALDCEEFDALGYTCEELDNFMVKFVPRGLTVWEWMNKARLWVWVDPKLKMFNYFTGKNELYKHNVDINNTLLKASGSYTASEFDSVGITAKQFDELNESPYDFDWHSNTTVLVGT